MSLFDPIRPKVSPAAITRVGRTAEGNAMALMVPIAPARIRPNPRRPPMPDPVTAQLSLFEFAPADPVRAAGMLVPRWTSLVAWHAELDHQTVIMRARSTLYARFETTARLLTTGRIRETRDIAAIERLVERLSAARFPWGHDLHDLDRVWSRAEFGTLLVEATNRLQLLRMGRLAPKPKGPRLDPARIPLGKLEALIQSHSDMAVVDACRAERNRRLIEERGTTSGR